MNANNSSDNATLVLMLVWFVFVVLAEWFGWFV